MCWFFYTLGDDAATKHGGSSRTQSHQALQQSTASEGTEGQRFLQFINISL